MPPCPISLAHALHIVFVDHELGRGVDLVGHRPDIGLFRQMRAIAFGDGRGFGRRVSGDAHVDNIGAFRVLLGCCA